ncbi:MAG: aspartyl/asparaginyl beta-hydroxylase domain-containing protein [Burkholderiaceae bacterium]|nr:aspartyl/asparaginyl beta-hydroxylase domain-containing protein [Burkholderiaceae bacterium]MCD8565820.1 aspartyl/asparaginyl beta-hydroxylase domain-containing protein [Burkholderiaceae bacterium]
MKWLILFLWGGAILYLQFRGQVRLTWQRQLLHASSALAPLNALALLLSKVPATPTIPISRLPELKTLEDNWETIRDESNQILAQQTAEASHDTVPPPIRINLVTAGKADSHAIQSCPQTLALLRQIQGIQSATLVEMPPHANIEPARAPYSGLLQVHLGLESPHHSDCYVDIDGIRQQRQEGQVIVLDPSFVTESNNGSQARNIILQCELQRPMVTNWANRANAWISRQVVQLTSAPDINVQPAPIRAILRGRQWLEHQCQAFDAAYKQANPTLYKAVKAGVVLLVVLLFLAI